MNEYEELCCNRETKIPGCTVIPPVWCITIRCTITATKPLGSWRACASSIWTHIEHQLVKILSQKYERR